MDDYMVQAHNTIWDEAYRKARSEPSLNDPALTLSQRSTITMRSLADALMTFRDMMHCRYSAEAHHHNTYLPISRLPNDLLVKIFALASEMEYRFMVSGHHGPGEVTTLARLVRVCREWRRIMDNTPSLWAYLSSSYPLPANFECLARSNQAPLHISFNYRWLKYEGGRELYTKIFEEVHRWKTVKLHNVTIEALNKLENWAAPLLETLDVQWNLETTLRTINLFCGSASRLRHLTLININIPWDSNLFSRLRTLHIYHYQIYSPSAQEVVQVLQSCPGLTRFRLHLPPEVHPGPIPLETPIIELLQLDYLSLRVHPLMTEHLLRRMRTPSCKYFSIDHAKATGPTFSAAMDHLNPSLSSILLAARKVDIVIKCNALDYKATAKIDKDEYDNESRMRDGDLAQYIRIQASGDRSTDELALGALSWLLDNVHTPSFSLPVSLRISDTTSLHAFVDGYH
ncbi:hypothetical protein FRB94_011211 [Tulasnella sp. JGI-2019a]|nr:hypothetical protein FRB94_011211 [Tulasnella sp. JGI-2019a]